MAGTVFLGASEYSVSENNPVVRVSVRRTGELTGGPVTVTIVIEQINATAGVDFQLLTPLPVVFQDGETEKFLEFSITDDTLSEVTESFAVSIANVENGTLLAPRTARVDILDDENPVNDPPEPPLVSDYVVTQQTFVAGFDTPINIEFTPDGSKMFVAEKGGTIIVHDFATGARIGTFVDIKDITNSAQDRGLLDIALHPDFPNQPYVYAFFVVDPPGVSGGGNAGADGGGNRFSWVVRYTADAATGFTTAVPGSQVILLGGAGQTLGDISGDGAIDSTSPSNVGVTDSEKLVQGQRDTAATYVGGFVQDYLKVDSRSHAGGALAFGPDGALYVSVGDGTSFDITDPRTVSVQNLNSLSGKILRIDPMTGQGLADNPYADGVSLDSNQAKVYQLGLRNPFSMGFDASGQLYITSTGWYTYEQILQGPPGANFGWPFYEGGDAGILVRQSGYQGLPEAGAFYASVDNGTVVGGRITPAFRAFHHDSGEPGFQFQAITGGAVIYTGNRYPVEFQNDYFFADFSDGEVFSVDTNDRRQIEYLYTASTGLAPIHFKQGPDGYIYAVDLITGTIQRLLIQGPAGGAPVAGDDAATTPEDTPLTIPEATLLLNDSDPQNDPLDIVAVTAVSGGSVALVGNNVVFTPTSNFNGAAQFDYTVSDGQGGEDIGRVTVSVSPRPDAPVAVNDVATAQRGTPQTIAVLSNDVEPDGEVMTVTSAIAASGAVVTINPNNTITYNAVAGTPAADTITYIVRDPGGLTATAQVAVTVQDAPVTPPFTLTGSASQDPVTGVFTLTPAADSRVGGVTSNQRLDVRQDFTISLEMFFGTSEGGADGAHIVLHNDPRGPTALGGAGDDAGYRGPTQIVNGIAMTFDTYNSGPAVGDLPADHAQFEDTDGTFRSTAFALPNLEDGVWRAVQVIWNAATGTLSYTLNGVTVGTLTGINLQTAYLGGSNFAHFAFVASTGGAVNLHQVRNVSTSGTFEGGPVGNTPPVAVDDVATTLEDTALTITPATLLANDTDVNPGQTLTITGVTAVTGGTVAIVGGNVVFTPTANFNGPAAFDYTVSDGAGGTDVGRVAVTVTPRPDAPVAVNDVATAQRGMPQTIAVLSNDVEPDGEVMTVTSAIAASGAVVTINPNNTITYNAVAGTPAADTITYIVRDPGGLTATAQVAVTVQDAPVTPPFTLTGSASQDPVTGVFTLTPAADSRVGGVTSNQRLDIRQDFTISLEMFFGTSEGGADGAHIVLHNDPRGPTALGGAGDEAGYRGATGIVNGIALTFDTWNSGSVVGDIPADHAQFEDTDGAFRSPAFALPNLEDGLWRTVQVIWNATTGTLSYTLNGVTVGTLTGINLQTAYLGGSNFAHFAFVASTGGAVNLHQVRNVSLVGTYEGGAPTNTPPVAVDDVATTLEDTALTITPATLLANDTDVNPGQTLTITGVTAVTGGTVAIVGGNVVFTPTANFNGPAAFDYTVSDGAGGTDVGRVAVTVTAVNDAPVAVNDVATVQRSVPQVINVLANDTDVEVGALIVTAAAAASDATVVINADNTITYTTAALTPATDTITYTIRDAGGLTSTAQVAVTVAANAPPVAVDDVATTLEDTALTITPATLLANDIDVNPGQTLTITGVTAVAGGTVAIVGGNVVFTPTANFNGPAAFDYTVSDGNGGTDVGRVAVTVTAVNDPPVLTTNNGANFRISVVENVAGPLITLGVFDADLVFPQFALVGGQDRTRFVIDPITGALALLAPPDFEAPTDADGNNTYVVQVEARDGEGAFDRQTITVQVTDVADGAPIIGTDGADTALPTTGGADVIEARGGADGVNGRGGNDVFRATVGDGNDRYNGGGGQDTYDLSLTTAAAVVTLADGSGQGSATSAQTGTDVLISIERIIGGQGADIITGNSGDNILAGGIGDDTLTGGAGDDTFLFQPGGGRDIITDFQDDGDFEDILDLTAFGIEDANTVIAGASQVGADTVIDLGGGNIIVLQNFILANLDTSDFII